MKKFTFGILIAASMAFAPAAYAEDGAYCFHVKKDSRDPHSVDPYHNHSNTGTHGIEDDSYYKDSGYITRCRSPDEGDVVGWASYCARRFNKYYAPIEGGRSNYAEDHPVGSC